MCGQPMGGAPVLGHVMQDGRRPTDTSVRQFIRLQAGHVPAERVSEDYVRSSYASPGKPRVSYEVSDSSPTTARAATTTTATGCVPQSRVTVQRRGVPVAVMLIERFDGDVDQFRRAYDRAHAHWAETQSIVKAGMNLMDGLGFGGVIQEQHTFVCTRNRARLRHSLATADDAGNRCRMMRIALGRSADQFVSEIGSSKGVDR